MGINRLRISLGNVHLSCPLLTASGTSGSGGELEALRHRDRLLGCLGAFVTKGVTLMPRTGNPEYRVVEARTGLLNSIGLQNNGADAFLSTGLPQLLRYELPIIVNISADTVAEFGELAGRLLDGDAARLISGIEINVSCPNIKEGGMAFGVCPDTVERIVRSVRRAVAGRAIIVTKLSPNVTDITAPARAAIAGGSDALSMINTVRGMAINVENRKAFLGATYGGLSGPAIKPIGVYAVYRCFEEIPDCRSRRVPIIGLGGISTWQDAVEYILAGATGVAIGTAWFVNTNVFEEVKRGISRYLEQNDTTMDGIIGAAHCARRAGRPARHRSPQRATSMQRRRQRTTSPPLAASR